MIRRVPYIEVVCLYPIQFNSYQFEVSLPLLIPISSGMKWHRHETSQESARPLQMTVAPHESNQRAQKTRGLAFQPRIPYCFVEWEMHIRSGPTGHDLMIMFQCTGRWMFESHEVDLMIIRFNNSAQLTHDTNYFDASHRTEYGQDHQTRLVDERFLQLVVQKDCGSVFR